MDITTVLSQIDAATTAAGQRVDKLISSIKANGATLTPEQEAEAVSIVSHLSGIAADPANPVPATTGDGSGASASS